MFAFPDDQLQALAAVEFCRRSGMRTRWNRTISRGAVEAASGNDAFLPIYDGR